MTEAPDIRNWIFQIASASCTIQKGVSLGVWGTSTWGWPPNIAGFLPGFGFLLFHRDLDLDRLFRNRVLRGRLYLCCNSGKWLLSEQLVQFEQLVLVGLEEAC